MKNMSNQKKRSKSRNIRTHSKIGHSRNKCIGNNSSQVKIHQQTCQHQQHYCSKALSRQPLILHHPEYQNKQCKGTEYLCNIPERYKSIFDRIHICSPLQIIEAWISQKITNGIGTKHCQAHITLQNINTKVDAREKGYILHIWYQQLPHLIFYIFPY